MYYRIFIIIKYYYTANNFTHALCYEEPRACPRSTKHLPDQPQFALRRWAIFSLNTCVACFHQPVGYSMSVCLICKIAVEECLALHLGSNLSTHFLLTLDSQS